MFEQVHGSALDIAGKGMANPIGQIYTMKMTRDHFGEEELGSVLLDTVESVTNGGEHSPKDVTEEIIDRLEKK